MPRHYEDFTGKEINGLKVKGLINNSGGAGRHKKWLCECPTCHKDFVVQSNHIKDNKTKQCSECSRAERENLIGKKFNHLTVESMLPFLKHKRTICICKCDCGSNGIYVQANHLKSGETKSCGCLLSHPEEIIASILTDNNIEYYRQKTFPDLKYKHSLRFDFYIPNINTVIEYNGEQHYKPIDHYGGEENFEIQKIRDKIKEEYCINNDINYIVIRYDEDIFESLLKNNIIVKR